MNRVSLWPVIIIILIICLVIGGCNTDPSQKGLSIKKYNDAVAGYNRLATSFTKLARLVEKYLQEQCEPDKGFIYQLEVSKNKVLLCAAELEEHLQQEEEMCQIYHRIRLLIDKINVYISMVESGTRKSSNMHQHGLLDMHRTLCSEMLELSSDIVSEFDSVYEQIIYE